MNTPTENVVYRPTGHATAPKQYHERAACPAVAVRATTARKARTRGYQPCPDCIGDDR